MKYYFLLLLLFLFQSVYSQSYDVLLQQQIAENVGNFNIPLDSEDWFGYTVEGIGDLNGDGINDIAVAAIKDDDGGFNRGAVYVLFLNNDGTINSNQKISDLEGNFSGVLDDWDIIGSSLSYLGDMNGDGLIEIGVGAEYDGDGGYRNGAVWILSLNSNGTVNSYTKISDTQGGFSGGLGNYNVFGSDIELLGDLNGDGNQDIAVGARRDPDGNSYRGALWILFLNADFSVNSYQKISDTSGNFNAGLNAEDYFGGAVANIGDLNNDGVIDLAVGAYRDDEGGLNHGAIYILFMNSDGTVDNYQKINEVQGNFNEYFSNSEIFFGISIDKCADINGDGLTEIVVGAPGYRNSSNEKIGAFYILNLNPNGTVDSYEKYTEGLHNFTGSLNDYGSFGFSVSYIGALQENHCVAVDAYKYPVGGLEKGSAWVLQFGESVLLPDVAATLDEVSTICNSRIIDVDYTISNIGDGAIPANTPIAFYADNDLVGTAATQNNIPMYGSETGSISLNIPAGIPQNFTISITVDDDGTGSGTIAEANESNNTDSDSVEFISAGIINPLNDLYICDDVSSDGIGIFDLTENTTLAIGNQANVTVSYHLSQMDANLDLDAIIDPVNFQNVINPQEIFLRLENNMNPTCYSVESFLLTVVPKPITSTLDPWQVCDDPSNNGIAVFDLMTLIPDIVGNQQNVTISFHETSSDALTGINAIPNPQAYENMVSPQIIYIRVESVFLNTCFAIVPLELTVAPNNPIISFGELQNCDEGFGSSIFDLTNVEMQGDLEIIGFYPTENDAINNTEPIENLSNFQNTINPQVIYIRIENPNDPCYHLGTLKLIVENCSIFVPEGFSPNGDGINDTFEISGLYNIFPNFELTIFSRYGNIVYEGNNTVPEWDGTNNHGVGGGGNQLPTGTYYYILNLNDPEYQIMKSWVYLIH